MKPIDPSDPWKDFSKRAAEAEAAIEAAYERDAEAEIEARDAAFVAWVEGREVDPPDAAPPPKAVPPNSSADVLSVKAAAQRLPWRLQVALSWLRTQGLVRTVDLGDGRKPREYVVWGEVVRHLADPLDGGGRFFGP